MKIESGLKKLYRLIGVVENHRLVLDISKDRFIDLLKPHVGTDGSSSLDMFSSGATDYKGVVGSSGFYLRRKRGWTNNTRHFCKVEGTFHEENNQLILDLEFKNFPPGVWMFLIVFLFFGLGTVVTLLISILTLNYENIVPWLSNLFSVAIFFGIFGAIIRVFSGQTITKMKYELENNFQRYLFTKN